jgi:uncharacterized protein
MSGTVALAIWVKTPGRTPAKTRLAAATGAATAEAFYRRAVAAVHEVAERAAADSGGLLAPVWAVAEDEGDALAWWRGFPVIAQGGGGLGERLAHVYDALRERHAAVLFIGADAPQLAPSLLASSARALARGADDFVLGPADDGGFYLFGGRRPLPAATWTGVTYSAATTRAELAARLARHGTVRELAPAFDVDTIDDLRRLRTMLAERDDLGPAGDALRDWLLATRQAGA